MTCNGTNNFRQSASLSYLSGVHTCCSHAYENAKPFYIRMKELHIYIYIFWNIIGFVSPVAGLVQKSYDSGPSDATLP